jgi:hypothetical protein
MLHLVLDVLVELNELNQKFQYGLIDILTIESIWDSSILIFERHFLCGHKPNFG